MFFSGKQVIDLLTNDNLTSYLAWWKKEILFARSMAYNYTQD